MADPTISAGGSFAVATATALAFVPFGVSITTLMLGGGCFWLGCAARTGAKIYKKLDGIEDVTLKDVVRAFATLLCCIPMAAVASCIVFLAAYQIGVKADAACGGALLVGGLRGLEGYQWLVDTSANIFTKLVPGNKTTGGGQ